MLDKLTDNIKFFIMLLVYVIYLTWWASGLNTTVENQLIVQQKTVVLLDKHIEDCSKKEMQNAVISEKVRHLRHDVDILITDSNMELGK